MGITLSRRAGVHEGNVRPASGLRHRQHLSFHVPAQTAIVNAQTVGRAGAAKQPDFDLPSSNLIVTVNAGNGETVTIGGKVYTWKAAITTADGDVQIGGDIAASLANLRAAINLSGGAGTAYGALTTKHPSVTVPEPAVNSTLTVIANEAHYVVAVSETMANGSWSLATMAAGNLTLAGKRVNWPSTLVVQLVQTIPQL
ncbi:MAG TPA: hypothetical protein VFM38_00950, partial [Candidatus Limnocylindrales bacterium]|nr:hypothetical protein [Candidatus Limnocylindrales bacterium]